MFTGENLPKLHIMESNGGVVVKNQVGEHSSTRANPLFHGLHLPYIPCTRLPESVPLAVATLLQ